MFQSNDRPAAPNYTSACIVMFGINLAWILMLTWVLWGILAAVVLAACINATIAYIRNRRNA